MLSHHVQRLCVCLLMAGAGLCAAPAQLSAELTTEQIVQRALTRAQWVQDLKRHTNYSYQKTTVVEELDGKGRVKASKEKLLQFESGVSTLKEIKRNGKTVPLPAQREADAEATADRQHVTKGSRTRRDDNWTEYLNKEFTARYTFELVGREDV